MIEAERMKAEQVEQQEAHDTPRIGIVIPSYRVTAHILGVLAAIGPEVARIYVVDDCCPDASGTFVETHTRDPRVRVVRRERNGGVGAATITGYRAALADDCDVIVKIDGDGQMDPRLLPRFVRPILAGQADYTKGNRFFNPEDVRAMPPIRLFGNAALSFMTKLSSGYWTLFDPTNGYTAIHAKVTAQLPLERISTRYFFESDMLFRLNTIRAMVLDIPMAAIYADETSHMRIGKVVPRFLKGHAHNFGKRLIYNYFLRDFSVASAELIAGLALLGFGATFGLWHWLVNATHGVVTTSGTVMLAALPVILGLQLLLSFLGYDIAAVPQQPIHPLLATPGETS
ncbi:MAG: glycosyltransferase family 2 protein [Acidocella sp.]|uniref:glycosyltransferase family 2 protein n=1 Tax=Acidocella sp. TaxID=50710 RepID=UPI003FBFCEFD